MAQTITISWRPSGSNKANAAARTFKPTAPSITTSSGEIKMISKIVRTNGAFGACGPWGICYQLVDHTDNLIDTSTGEVIAKSNTVNVRINGTGPASSDRATCTINLTREQSTKAVKAWRAGTLQIKRTLKVTYQTNASDAKAPTFRSGEYNDDITITGTNAAYEPTLTLSNFKAAAESALYANSGSAAPFTFSLSTSIAGSSYWEGTTVSKRLELKIENLSGGSAPVSGLPLAAVQNNTTATAWTLTQANFNFARANGGFSRGSRYRVTFTVKVGKDASDLSESASVSREIEAATVPMHFNRYGNGIGIGRYSSVTNKDAAGVLDIGWALNAHSGINGVTNYVSGEVATGGKWIDGKPIYRYVWTGTTTVSNGQVDICTLPSGSVFGAVISLYGMIDRADGAWLAVPNTYHSNANTWAANIRTAQPNVVKLGLGSSYTGTHKVIIVIEYTKGTASDIPMPGPEIMDEDLPYADPGIARADYVAMMVGIEIPADAEAAGDVQADAGGIEVPGIEGEPTHSAKFDTVKLYRDAGVWSDQMVRNAVGKWITADEAKEILTAQEQGSEGQPTQKESE